MIIHPARTNLLLLKEKAKSVINSTGTLKARRQALIHEFLKTSLPFLRSGDDIRKTCGMALDELHLSLGREGKSGVESITFTAARDMGINIVLKSIRGLKYKDITVKEDPVRAPEKRGYDLRTTTPHLEESIYLFEKVLESMIELAAFENKLKRISNEIQKISRKIKVLEEKVLQELKKQVKGIAQYNGQTLNSY